VRHEERVMNDLILTGDLCQMANQKRSLIDMGFYVGQTDVYPTIKHEDIKRALLHLYIDRVDGWWNYEHIFIEHGICSKEQFWKKFKGA
jgi:hypothetical protein